MYEQALCKGESLENFFERYEDDTDTALETDRLCNDCPVRLTCLTKGIKTDSTGVFGGVYIFLGKYSKMFNKHKEQSSQKSSADLVNNIRTAIRRGDIA